MAEEKPSRETFGRFLSRRGGSEEADADSGEDAPEETEATPDAESEAPPVTEAPPDAESEAPPATEVSAPSIGPHTDLGQQEAPEARLARHEQSSVDAMGLDKRREVVGGRYSPSFARQATIYGVFLAVLAALAIGFIALAGKLDEPPETNPDVAPWSREDAAQTPPAQLDFPNYGQTGGAEAPGPEL